MDAAEDRAALVGHVQRELPVPWRPEFRGGYPDEVEAALVDAVLSIRSRYGMSATTGVRGAVQRWRDERGVGGGRLDHLSRLAGVDGQALAGVLGNRQVLSGGLLKAEALCRRRRVWSLPE